MRTGIYVYAPTTIQISTTEDNLRLMPMSPESSGMALNRTNSISVERGVYKVLSNTAISVSSTGDVDIASATGTDKDKWPDPPPRVTGELGLTEAEVQEFFAGRSALHV